MKVVEYWHGTIKNYRYDGDVSIACITVGEQITVEQLIENRIITKTSKEMIMNIGITSVSSRLTPSCIYYYYSTH